MNNQILPSLRRGFTLVELLVVIAIIIILAATGFGVGRAAIQTAKKTVAKNHCVGLVTGVDAFYDDYQRLPGATSEDEFETDSDFMNVLIGFDEDENPKENRYFNAEEAKGKTADTATNGLFYQGRSAELFDPFRRDGDDRNRHYFGIMDADYDEELTDPVSGKTLYGKRSIFWSVGKDGEKGSGTNPQTRDNVHSWQ